MDSKISGTGAFVFGVGWRVLLAAACTLLFIYVIAKTQYYATALVLAAVAGLTLLDTVRMSKSSTAPLTTDVRARYREQARVLDQLAALLDAVTVALIAVTQDGKIAFINRAARQFAGEEVGWLSDIRRLGTEAAAILADLPPGARQILTIADGSSVLAWIGAFATPDGGTQKLISLQTVSGGLDAVQLKAWQDMTRILSHEIMNSLTPISSLAESLPGLLMDPAAGQEVAGAVETIGRRSHHLINFVQRYRQIANLPAPLPKELELDDFIADLEALLTPILAARGVAYSSLIEPDGLVFRADPDLLSQAILNLLLNAADAAGEAKKPEIKLCAQRREAEILFRIDDNGPGVPPDRLEEIFLPFFTSKPNGSGIGLTLARQIAHAHRGQVEATIGPGSGMSFTLSLPIDELATIGSRR